MSHAYVMDVTSQSLTDPVHFFASVHAGKNFANNIFGKGPLCTQKQTSNTKMWSPRLIGM